MNSVSETKKIIGSSLEPLPAITLPLVDAFGFALVDDLIAASDIPITNQANVNGYAIKFSDTVNTLALQATGSKTNNNPQTLNAGQALYIEAGSPIPLGTDTVVAEANTTISDETISIDYGTVMQGMNIKFKASEAAKGELLMLKGERLSPGAIGFLAGKGIAEVTIYRPPVVSIVSVGVGRQVEPGNELGPGQSFEANTYLLRAAIRQCNLNVHRVFQVEAEKQALRQNIQDAIDISDIIMITGSFDDEIKELVQSTIEANGVDGMVNAVKQSPGEDLYFGCASSKAVFILPGGPASVMTCFYEYVVQAIEIMTRKKNIVPVIKATMAGPYQKPAEYTYFLSGNFAKGRVTPVLSPLVSGVRSFISFNCLIVLPEEEINFQIGEEVEVHLLP